LSTRIAGDGTPRAGARFRPDRGRYQDELELLDGRSGSEELELDDGIRGSLEELLDGIRGSLDELLDGRRGSLDELDEGIRGSLELLDDGISGSLEELLDGGINGVLELELEGGISGVLLELLELLRCLRSHSRIFFHVSSRFMAPPLREIGRMAPLYGSGRTLPYICDITGACACEMNEGLPVPAGS